MIYGSKRSVTPLITTCSVFDSDRCSLSSHDPSLFLVVVRLFGYYSHV